MILGRLIQRARSFLCYRSRHRFYVLSTEPHSVQPRIPLELQTQDRWTQELAAHLDEIKGSPANWKLRFDRGHVCFLAMSNRAPAGYAWASPGEWRLRDEDPAGEIGSGVVFWYDELTAEPFRGNRVLPALLSLGVRVMRARGYDRACTLIEDRNRASRKCSACVGFVICDETVDVDRVLMCWRIQTKRGVAPESMRP